MSNAPICTVHNAYMKLRNGRNGQFWSCNQKNGNAWCDQNIPADAQNPAPQAAPVPVQAVPNPAATVPPSSSPHHVPPIDEGKRISKCAIAKEFIANGRKFEEAKEQADAWIGWILG